MHTGCLSAAPQRFITVQTAFALSPASKNRSASIVFRLRAPAKPPSPETILRTDRGNPNLPQKEFANARENALGTPISRLAGLCHANSLARQSIFGENDPRNVRGVLTRIWAPHTRFCMCWFKLSFIANHHHHRAIHSAGLQPGLLPMYRRACCPFAKTSSFPVRK